MGQRRGPGLHHRWLCPPSIWAPAGTPHIRSPVGGCGQVRSCQPPHRSEASASLGLSKTPGSSSPQQGEGFPQKALHISPKPLAPRPAVVVPTRICYFYVILHMKKIGDIEFVQIGGVLQQKQHVGQSEPGSRGRAGGLRVPGLEGTRPGAAQRSEVSSREWRAPGVRSGLCPGKATSRGRVGTVAHQTMSPSPRHTADEHGWMFIWGCGQTRGSYLRPPTPPPHAPFSVAARHGAHSASSPGDGEAPCGRERAQTSDEDGTSQGQEQPTKATPRVSKSRSFRNPLRADI